MRVLVCGGRYYSDREQVFSVLHDLAEKHGWLTIIEGGANGADFLARSWAKRFYHGLVTIDADWHLHGTAAGPIRNEKMIVSGKPDFVVAFPGGQGNGRYGSPRCIRWPRHYRGRAIMNHKRHSWGLPTRFVQKTERCCLNCPIIKVTFHQLDEHGRDYCWTEFYRGLDQIEGTNTPACEAVSETRATAANHAHG